MNNAGIDGGRRPLCAKSKLGQNIGSEHGASLEDARRLFRRCKSKTALGSSLTLAQSKDFLHLPSLTVPLSPILAPFCQHCAHFFILASLVISAVLCAGITAPPGNLAYNVSKVAVKAYIEGLQHELRSNEGNQLQAVLLVPGWTNTSIAIKTKHFDALAKGEIFDESSVFFSEGKPHAGAWKSSQVVEYLFERLQKNPDAFYIICPDNDDSRRRQCKNDVGHARCD